MRSRPEAVVDNLMPIGRFARACRLTVKALRHYDELGLLRPALVDVATGYRYYGRAQARTAIAIALLRSLGVPLPAIRELLAAENPEAMGRVLGAERDRLEREVTRAREALLSIERIIREGSVMPYEVTVRSEPARRVLMIEGTTAPERHVEATFALVARLAERLGSLEPAGPVREVYLNDPAVVGPSDLLTEVVVPLAPAP